MAVPHSSARGRYTQAQGSHGDLTTQRLVFPGVPALAAPPVTGAHPLGLWERLPVCFSRNKSEPLGLAEFWGRGKNSDAFTGTLPTGPPALRLLCLRQGAGIPDDFLMLSTIQREQQTPHPGSRPGGTRRGSSPQPCTCSGPEGRREEGSQTTGRHKTKSFAQMGRKENELKTKESVMGWSTGGIQRKGGVTESERCVRWLLSLPSMTTPRPLSELGTPGMPLALT